MAAGSSYSTLFGGNLVAPAQPTFLELALTQDVILSWPVESIAAGSLTTAEIIEVSANQPGLTVELSDATLVSNGYCFLFNNVGVNPVQILDNTGATLCVVGSGQVWQLYLADNSIPQGTYRAFQFGVGVSQANAAALAGLGLKAIATSLNERIAINAQGGNYEIMASDRASCVEFTGGSGFGFTTDTAAHLGSDWFCYLKNSGSGVISLTPGSGTINGVASLNFNPGDSAILCCDGGNFFTIGFGQAVASSFNFVQIGVVGGNLVLSGAQLNRVSYKFTGVLASNQTITVPASIQQYWIDNETTGAFTLTVTTGSGGTVTIPQGARQILYCDGTNVVNAVQSSGSGAVLAPDGTAAAPSISFGSDTALGFYKAGTDILGIATAGVQRGNISAAGNWNINAPVSGVALTLSGNNTGGVQLNAAGFNDFFRVTGPAATALGGFVLQQGIQSPWQLYQAAGSPDLRLLSQTDRVIFGGTPGTSIAMIVNAYTSQPAAQFIGAAGDAGRISIVDSQVGGHDWRLRAGVTAIGAFDITDFTVNATRLSISSTGNFSLSAPSSGTALVVGGASGAGVLSLVSGNSASQSISDVFLTRSGSTANAIGKGPNIQIEDLLGNTSTMLQHAGGQTELWQFNNNAWAQLGFWDVTRTLHLNPPAANAWGLVLNQTTLTFAPLRIVQQINGYSIRFEGGNYVAGGNAFNMTTTNGPAGTGVNTGWLAIDVNGGSHWIPYW